MKHFNMGVILWIIISGFIGHAIDSKNGGWLWGGLLGPIGWIIAAILKPKVNE